MLRILHDECGDASGVSEAQERVVPLGEFSQAHCFIRSKLKRVVALLVRARLLAHREKPQIPAVGPSIDASIYRHTLVFRLERRTYSLAIAFPRQPVPQSG